MSQEELRDYYHEAEMLIINSETETWGLVINEAMCCSCAILSSIECGASSALVKPGENGYIIRCNDIREMVNSLVDYHNLEDAKKNKMKQASKEIIKDWGLDKFSGGVIKAIDFVKSQPKRKTTLISKILIKNWYGQYKPI